MIHSKFIHHSHDLCGAHFFDLQVLKESKRAHQSSQSMPNLPNFKKDETRLTSFKLSKLSKKTSTFIRMKVGNKWQRLPQKPRPFEPCQGGTVHRSVEFQSLHGLQPGPGVNRAPQLQHACACICNSICISLSRVSETYLDTLRHKQIVT